MMVIILQDRGEEGEDLAGEYHDGNYTTGLRGGGRGPCMRIS